MKYRGLIRRSRTYDAAALLAVFGAVQATLPQLQLDPQWIGIINMGLAIVIAFLRSQTTGPVGDK